MSGREVWITGAGAVTGAGVGTQALLALLLSGASATRRLHHLAGRWGVAAPDPALGRVSRRLDRSAVLMVAAAEEAWADAGLDETIFDPARTDVIEGSSLGCFGGLLHAYRDRLNGQRSALGRPSALTQFLLGAGSARFAEAHGIRGRVVHLSAGSVSATYALLEAFERIAAGRSEIAVAGGAECALHEDVVDIFELAGLLADPAEGLPCRPFDRDRNGTVLGEGAGALVLEAADHAKARGKKPRAILAGGAMTCEAYDMTDPDPTGRGVAEAIRGALAEVPGEEVGWVKAHGTGTRLNDAAEWRGLATVFGGRLDDIPITALKPTIGHCLGASGAVEAVASVLALEQGVAPPTLGTTSIDPELQPCRVASQSVPLRPSATLAVLLSESFGGRCAALALRRAISAF